MSDGTSFGRLLKVRRRALDLTQEDLAKLVKYSVITIRKIEADERRPSRQLAEQLALVLDIAAAERSAFVALARASYGRPAMPPRFDPVRPSGSRPLTNVPAPLTRLIGRDQEAKSVQRILLQDAVRLVTLVGPPGIGKSRLGLQVASSVLANFPDGVFFVPLAPIGDPMLVAPTIAKTLDVKELAGQSLIDRLIDVMHDLRILLLLDDFDHMLGAAPFVAEILTACPGPKVLATSRAPLHLRGERLFPVPPLDLPGRGLAVNARAALQYGAVELFLERAQDAKPDFALSDANASDVAAICAHLDGLPLAIELVAARTRLMTPSELVARLGQRLALLTDGPLDLPARQQTMRSTIDWSYDLLDAGEQMLFARMSVFVGGCSMGAAEEVVNVNDDLPLPILDGLSALVTKNLLGQEDRLDGNRHYVLLEIIREYANERLTARGEEREVRDRHAACYLRLAEAASTHLTSQEQQRWLDRLEAARDNLGAAMEWYVHSGATDESLRLVAALWKFWHIRSRQAEGHRWITLVLDSDAAQHHDARAQALHGAGWIALDRRDLPLAQTYFSQSLAVFRQLHDSAGIAEALHGVGICAQARGEHAVAAALFRESLQLYRRLHNEEGVAWSLDHLGDTTLNMADNEQAEALFGESLAIFRRLQHTWGTAISLHHHGLAALARSDATLANDRLHESLALFQDLDNCWGIATSFDHLGYAALLQQDHRRAREHFVTALMCNRAEQDRDGFARSLTGLASLAIQHRKPEPAARMFGAAEAMAEGAGINMDPVARLVYERDTASVRSALEPDVIIRARSAGREMTMDQLVELAVASC